MAEIIPVEDKLRIQAYCLKFDVQFDLSYSAYVAFDKGEAVGMCVFRLLDGECDIKSLTFSEEICKTPIPFLLLRSVVHFADCCGIGRIIARTAGVSQALADKTGFVSDDNDCRIYYYKGYIDR